MEFCRQYHRQFSRLLTLYNPTDVVARLAVGIESAGAVAHEDAGFGLLEIGEDRRQSVAGHQDNQLDPLSEEKGVGAYEQRTDPLLFNGREGIVDVALRAGMNNLERLSDGRSCFLHCRPFSD